MGVGTKETESCDLVQEESVGVMLGLSVVSVMMAEVESLVGDSVGDSADMVASAESVTDAIPVVTEEVGTSEGTVIASVMELVSLGLLVSSVFFMMDNDSAILSVLSEVTGIDVETVVTSLVKALNTEEVAVDGSEATGVERYGSCLELEIMTGVIVVFLELGDVSVSLLTSEVVNTSIVVLLRFGEELVPCSKLVSTMSEVLISPGVRTVVTEAEEEMILLGKVKEVGEGEVKAGEDTRKDGVLVSSTGKDLGEESSLDIVFLNMGLSECVRP